MTVSLHGSIVVVTTQRGGRIVRRWYDAGPYTAAGEYAPTADDNAPRPGLTAATPAETDAAHGHDAPAADLSAPLRGVPNAPGRVGGLT